MAIDNASGDITLFIDDGAVAEERWMEKCLQLFEELLNASGMNGVAYKVYIENSTLREAGKIFYHDIPTERIFTENLYQNIIIMCAGSQNQGLWVER
jgi:hypothetical protein